MPNKRDNDAERRARLEELMEEYRVNLESTREKIDEFRTKSAAALRQAKARLRGTRDARKKK